MICGVALFWYLYSKLDTKEIFSILKSDINYFWIAVSMVISIFSHIARAFRWRLQLRALGLSPSMRSLVNAIFGTYAMNLVFPRLGEVWRCGYIAHREKSSFSQVFGSMVSDRLTDTLTVLILTISVFFLNMNVFLKFLSDYPSVQQGLVNTVTSPWLYAILLLAIGSVLWLFRKNTTNKWALKVKAMVQNLWTGFSTVLKMKGKFQFLFYTIFIWTCYFLQLYVCFFAFQWTKDLGILVALTLYVLGSLSMGLPVPGGARALAPGDYCRTLFLRSGSYRSGGIRFGCSRFTNGVDRIIGNIYLFLHCLGPEKERFTGKRSGFL